MKVRIIIDCLSFVGKLEKEVTQDERKFLDVLEAEWNKENNSDLKPHIKIQEI